METKRRDPLQSGSVELYAYSPATAMIALLLVLLSISVAVNVLLAGRLRNAGELLAGQNPLSSLKPNTPAPAIRASDLQRNAQMIGFARQPRPTLLYVFTPSCGWCSKNVDNLKTLATHARNSHRVIGLSLSSEGLAEYVAKHGINFPVFHEPNQAARKAYRLGGTPATILISAEGRVLKVWMGAWAGSAQAEIEKHFGVRLPGLVDARATLIPDRPPA